MNSTALIQSGGIQQVIAAPQIIYLDFDGELTAYNGEILTVDEVTVEDSRLSKERIAEITSALNRQFAGENVRFVSDLSDLPDESDYSTIYIGKTSDFEEYGSFAGFAETVDHGNQNKRDNAFVLLDHTSDNAQIIETIAHEAGHLLGTLDHGGEGLEKYAADYDYEVQSGETSSGIVLNSQSMYIHNGGSASQTTIHRGGFLEIESGGRAEATKTNGGTVFVAAGGILDSSVIGNECYVNIQGSLEHTVFSGFAQWDMVAFLHVWNGGSAVNNSFSFAAVTIHNGGIVDSSILGEYCYTTVSSGGLLQNTIATRIDFIHTHNAGCISISAGGTAKNTTIDSNYIMYLQGNAINTTLQQDNCELWVSSGGFAQTITNANRGHVYIYSGGTAQKIYNAQSGYLGIFSGGTATQVHVDGGCLFIDVASDTYTHGQYHGSAFEVKNGILSNFNMASGTVISVYQGCRTLDLMVNSGASVYIASGGSADIRFSPWMGYITSSAGAIVTYQERDAEVYWYNSSDGSLKSGASASGLDLTSCRGIVYSNGQLENTLVGNGGNLVVSSGGTVIDTIINHGSMHVNQDAIASGIVLHSGVLYIAQNTTINDLTVSHGSLTVPAAFSLMV